MLSDLILFRFVLFELLDVDGFEFLTWSDPDFIEDSESGCAGLGSVHSFREGHLGAFYID